MLKHVTKEYGGRSPRISTDRCGWMGNYCPVLKQCRTVSTRTPRWVGCAQYTL